MPEEIKHLVRLPSPLGDYFVSTSFTKHILTIKNPVVLLPSPLGDYFVSTERIERAYSFNKKPVTVPVRGLFCFYYYVIHDVVIKIWYTGYRPR